MVNLLLNSNSFAEVIARIMKSGTDVFQFLLDRILVSIYSLFLMVERNK